MFPNYKTLIIIFTIVLLLLLIPFVAMQFTNEVNWSFFDFIVAGILLLVTSLTIDFVLQKIKSRKNQIIIVAIIIILLLLLWAELAVGIFGSPIAGN
jgi:asparagine N-glycosylation enzyme membrane subunit Stt3